MALRKADVKGSGGESSSGSYDPVSESISGPATEAVSIVDRRFTVLQQRHRFEGRGQFSWMIGDCADAGRFNGNSVGRKGMNVAICVFATANLMARSPRQKLSLNSCTTAVRISGGGWWSTLEGAD